MKIQRISIPKALFAEQEKSERDFFLFAGHILNEINSINKVFVYCLNGDAGENPIEVERLASGPQALIYARILAGKLSEAWAVLGKSWFGTKLSNKLENLLHDDSRGTLKSLKNYFGRANTINQVRNSFAFHYNAQALGDCWELTASEKNFEIIAGGVIGNNLYLGAELVANAALLSSIDSENMVNAQFIFFEEIQAVAANFNNFLEGAAMIILDKIFNGEIAVREDEISPKLAPDEVFLPYFCRIK